MDRDSKRLRDRVERRLRDLDLEVVETTTTDENVPANTIISVEPWVIMVRLMVEVIAWFIT